jgi:hypothetical protein
MMNPTDSRRLAAHIQRTNPTVEERWQIMEFAKTVTSWDDLPDWIKTLPVRPSTLRG